MDTVPYGQSVNTIPTLSNTDEIPISEGLTFKVAPQPTEFIVAPEPEPIQEVPTLSMIDEKIRRNPNRRPGLNPNPETRIQKGWVQEFPEEDIDPSEEKLESEEEQELTKRQILTGALITAGVVAGIEASVGGVAPTVAASAIISELALNATQWVSTKKFLQLLRKARHEQDPAKREKHIKKKNVARKIAIFCKNAKSFTKPLAMVSSVGALFDADTLEKSEELSRVLDNTIDNINL